MTTQTRDFKFAGAKVQRLYLVMVDLTIKIGYQRNMVGFVMGGHNNIIIIDVYTLLV